MVDQGMTPEEKLLRIIESPGGEAPRNLPRARMNVGSSGLFLKAWLTHYRAQFTKKVSLKVANRAVVVLCMAATVYLALDFLIGMPNAALIERLEKAARKTSLGNIGVEALNPLSLYLQEIGQDSIFSLPPPPASSATPAQAEAAAALKNMAQTLRVVGIIWSDIPQVMIEDTKEGRTYSLNRGSRFKDAIVKEILRDRVILSYDNQEIELR